MLNALSLDLPSLWLFPVTTYFGRRRRYSLSLSRCPHFFFSMLRRRRRLYLDGWIIIDAVVAAIEEEEEEDSLRAATTTTFRGQVLENGD